MSVRSLYIASTSDQDRTLEDLLIEHGDVLVFMTLQKPAGRIMYVDAEDGTSFAVDEDGSFKAIAAR